MRVHFVHYDAIVVDLGPKSTTTSIVVDCSGTDSAVRRSCESSLDVQVGMISEKRFYSRAFLALHNAGNINNTASSTIGIHLNG